MRGTPNNPRGSGYCGCRLHKTPLTLAQFRKKYPGLNDRVLQARHDLYLEHWEREHNQPPTGPRR